MRACVPSRPAPPHHRRLACYLLPATCCLLLAACYLLLALLAACCLLLAAAASCCLLLLFAASLDAYCCCLCCRLPPSPTRSSLFPFLCSESRSCLRCDNGPAMRQGRPAASDLRDVVGIPRQLRGLRPMELALRRGSDPSRDVLAGPATRRGRRASAHGAGLFCGSSSPASSPDSSTTIRPSSSTGRQ